MRVSMALALTGAILAAGCARPSHADPHAAPETSATAAPTTGPSNGQLAFKGPRFTAWLVEPDGSDLHAIELPERTATISPWAYSPDGTRLVYFGLTKAESGPAIYVSDADGSGLTDLTSTHGDPREVSQSNPEWSPNGSQIAFRSDGDLSMQGIYLMNADGMDIHRLADGVLPTWAPDGSTLAYIASTRYGSSGDIYTIATDGTHVSQLTDTPSIEDSPVWSPDGAHIAYVRDGRVWVMNADGSDPRQVTDIATDGVGVLSLEWSPDGTMIAFEAFTGRSWDIYTVHPDGTALRPLADTDGDEIQPVWSPDGTLIAYLAGPQESATSGDNTGRFDVYTVRPDGTGMSRLTTDAGGAGGSLAWQPLWP